MNIKKIRGILSTILILSALTSLFTGAVLLFLKYGMWLVFTRKFLYDVHAVSGFIMGITVIVHFIINYRMYKAELKEIYRKER